MTIQHKLVLLTISIGAPLILWAMLYLIARYSALNMRLVVPWIRTLRWLTWLTTMVLLFMGFVLPYFPYGFLSLCVSLGVMLIDTWAIKRFAPNHRGIWPRFGVQ
ncbi:MAG: hypothetical protein WB249_02615 [Candidatus Sulfotelmatobacter sp.]